MKKNIEVENLSDSELLAVIVGKGNKAGSAVKISSSLLNIFGGFRKMSTYRFCEIQRIKGIGPQKALEIKACLEIARRFQGIKLEPGNQIGCSHDIFSYYHEKLRDKKKEMFFSIMLDSKHCIIKEELISMGSLNLSIVHPREVFSPAIKESAESILLIHNHPSGDPTPSKEDISVTRRLIEVGRLVGIEVIDHIIIGNGAYVSFLEERLL